MNGGEAVTGRSRPVGYHPACTNGAKRSAEGWGYRAEPPRNEMKGLGLDGGDPSGVPKQKTNVAGHNDRRLSGFIKGGVAGNSPLEGVAEAPEVGLQPGEGFPLRICSSV